MNTRKLPGQKNPRRKRKYPVGTCYKCGIASQSKGLCSACQYAKNLKSYNLTPAEAYAMRIAQDNKCAICGAEWDKTRKPGPGKLTGLVIDHCHTTNRVRAYLCHSCNTILGASQENIERLRKVIEYLERHSSLSNSGQTS